MSTFKQTAEPTEEELLAKKREDFLSNPRSLTLLDFNNIEAWDYILTISNHLWLSNGFQLISNHTIHTILCQKYQIALKKTMEHQRLQ
jgi:hypothetical protein